jgi:hypothetical protein
MCFLLRDKRATLISAGTVMQPWTGVIRVPHGEAWPERLCAGNSMCLIV